MKTVKSVQANGTWEKDGKTFYKFEYEMTDGYVIDVMHMTTTPKFNAGDEVDVTSKGERNGKPYGKLDKAGFAGQGQGAPRSSQIDISWQWAINAAIEVEKTRKIDLDFTGVKDTARRLMEMRDNLKNGV